MIEKFENALDLFMDAMFAGAKKHFQESLKITPGKTGPSEAYIALCNEYEKNPPLQICYSELLSEVEINLVQRKGDRFISLSPHPK